MTRNIELDFVKIHQEKLRATWRPAPDRATREAHELERPSRRPVLLAVWAR